jgi:hypothetical protein
MPAIKCLHYYFLKVESALIEERNKSRKTVEAEVEIAVEAALIEERNKSRKTAEAEVEIAVEAALAEERRKFDVVITAARKRADEAESNQRATLSLVRDQQLNMINPIDFSKENFEKIIQDYVGGNAEIITKNYNSLPEYERPVYVFNGEDEHQKVAQMGGRT